MKQPLPSEFDGTWRFEEPEEEEGYNYLHFSNGNRVVQFYKIKDGSFEDGRMLIGYIGDHTIEFYPKDGSVGWTRKFRFEDQKLVIQNLKEGKEFHCSRLQDIPEWLASGIALSDSYFDENEPNWGHL